MIIETSVKVIKVSHFGYIGNSSARLFNDWYEYSNIVGRVKVLPFIIFQIFLMNVFEQLRIECSKMTRDIRIFPNSISLENSWRNFP